MSTSVFIKSGNAAIFQNLFSRTFFPPTRQHAQAKEKVFVGDSFLDFGRGDAADQQAFLWKWSAESWRATVSFQRLKNHRSGKPPGFQWETLGGSEAAWLTTGSLMCGSWPPGGHTQSLRVPLRTRVPALIELIYHYSCYTIKDRHISKYLRYFADLIKIKTSQ